MSNSSEITKIPCQVVEMMIEPEYCDKISEKGTFCCCSHQTRPKEKSV